MYYQMRHLWWASRCTTKYCCYKGEKLKLNFHLVIIASFHMSFAVWAVLSFFFHTYIFSFQSEPILICTIIIVSRDHLVHSQSFPGSHFTTWNEAKSDQAITSHIFVFLSLVKNSGAGNYNFCFVLGSTKYSMHQGKRSDRGNNKKSNNNL